jgi:hypothetical protein
MTHDDDDGYDDGGGKIMSGRNKTHRGVNCVYSPNVCLFGI